MVSIAPFSEPPVPPGGGLHRQGGGDSFAGSPFRIHCADCVIRGLGGSGDGVGEHVIGDLGRPPAPAGALGAGSIAGDGLTVHLNAFHVRGGLYRQGSPLTGADRAAPVGLEGLRAEGGHRRGELRPHQADGVLLLLVVQGREGDLSRRLLLECDLQVGQGQDVVCSGGIMVLPLTIAFSVTVIS